MKNITNMVTANEKGCNKRDKSHDNLDYGDTKCLFFLDVGQVGGPPENSYQSHMVSYCSAIKLEDFCQICCSPTF